MNAIRFTLFTLLLIPAFASAQDPPAPLRVSIGMAGFSYEGDFTYGEEKFRRFYPGTNFAIQFEGKKPLQLQVNAGFGKFREQSDDQFLLAADGVTPNTYVETSFFYTDLRLTLRLLKHSPVRPVLGAGLGMLNFNPRDQEGTFLGENIFSRLENEVYGTTALIIPLSAGLEMRLNRKISLGLAYIYRITASDYLDNVSALGLKQGNDALYNAQLSLNFTLGEQLAPKLPAPAQPPTWPEVAVSQPVADPADSLMQQEPDWMRLWAEEESGNVLNSVEPVETLPNPAEASPRPEVLLLEKPSTLAALAKTRKLDPEKLAAANPRLEGRLPAGTVVFIPGE
ncbi:MAG: hypothetical protein EAZ89_19940 [Bacteroidetes bacterium]|nr:MAG: hypothetical protein EAZ89_19940 [Bacteroidota bacterium]